MNTELRQQLLEMWDEDCRVRKELAASGELFEGYAPRMAEVHNRNAEVLQQIINQVGWPGKTLVGEDGTEAAWGIVQHAIGQPVLQRRCLELLQVAAANGEANPQHIAYLEDRIAVFENRPQRYSTQFDWDEDGNMSPQQCDDMAQIDARRATIGLEPMATLMARIRAEVAASGEEAPGDFRARQVEKRLWAQSVGWLSDNGNSESALDD